MEGKKRFLFLAVVFFFCGSVVLMAAHELRVRAMRDGRGSTDGAKKLINELRGDVLVKSSKEVVSPEALPTRRPGSYLPENDRKKLNSLLKNVLPSTD